MADKPTLEGEHIGKGDVVVFSNKLKTGFPEVKEPVEGEVIHEGRNKKLLDAFAEIAERDLIKRFTPIEGEVIGPDERCQVVNVIKSVRITRGNDIEGDVIPKSLVPVHSDGTPDLYAIIQNARRHPGSAEPIEGEVVPPSAREQGLNFMLTAMKKAHRNPRKPVLEGEIITPADDAKQRTDRATDALDVLSAIYTSGFVELPPIWLGGPSEKEVKEINPLLIEKKE